MMRRLSPLLVLLLIPAAAGQLNSPQPFEADYQFADMQAGEPVTIISAEMDANIVGAGAPFAFFGTTGLRVEGLDRVCWGNADGSDGECEEQPGMQIVVFDGGSVGLSLPVAVDATFTADHALAAFVRVKGEDVNSVTINQSILAPAVNARMVFDEVAKIPDFLLTFTGFNVPPGILAPALEDTVVEVQDKDGNTIKRLTGKDEILFFSGDIVIPPFVPETSLLPFEQSSSARFTEAPQSAADQGLRFERINQAFQTLQASNRDQADQQQDDTTGSVGPLEEILSEVMNGALIRVPTGNASRGPEDFALVRFESMTVENSDGRLAWNGQAALAVQDGEVQGAQKLIGFWLFKLPWWGYMLWIVAIGMFVARLVVRPPTEHPLWDRYRWVGWLAGILMFLLVAFLWDLEMRTVWGTSVLTTDASGTALWITVAVQFATMFLVLGVVAAPLAIILKNSLMLGRQGSFMRLSGPAAFLLAYLIGATLLLAYINLILQEVLQSVA